MSVKIRFNPASTAGVVLAKVGNPQREEPLQTSKEVFKIEDSDQNTLTALFLKPFKNLMGHRFTHHSSLSKHEMNSYTKGIFASEDGLLKYGCEIAKRLYVKSNHPNIKAGDLCVALIRDIEVNGELTLGLCILKSETVTPFFSITTSNGDLHLATVHGINPEKIDKGCLILDTFRDQGYYVLTFDRSGAESRFWIREFLGVRAVPDAAFLTKSYTNLAVSVMESEKPTEESPPEKNVTAAGDALGFFDDKENFDLKEFEEKVLKTPEAKSRFAEEKKKIEEETGAPLEKSFQISKKHVSQAKKKVNTVVKLDSGVEIHLKPIFATQKEPVLERGFDEEKGMKFIKVFFNKDLSGEG